jgi:hypothetical protein
LGPAGLPAASFALEDDETLRLAWRLKPRMHTSNFFHRIAPGVARLAALGAIVFAFALRGAAQQPAIPDAPTVPVAPTLPDNAIIKDPLPPQASQEIIEERPSPSHAWVAGHWRWQEGRYAWVAGRWEIPPRANVVWVEPRWERRGAGVVLSGGYWQEAPAPVAVPTTPAPAPAQEVVIVTAPPPVPVREYIVERPSPMHVWIGGYWSWRLGKHVWIGGHWDLPPRTNVMWVEPRWERRGSGYVFVEGYWTDATPVRVVGPGPREVMIPHAPPPPRRERMPARPPGPGYVWVSGYWAWHDGRHFWVSGHYERPPRERAVWVEPRWERRGGGYIFIEGVWR